MSDSHDHIDNMKKVLRIMKEENVEVVIHCGDFCSPFIINMLKDIEVPIHGVFGNVDGDKFRMMNNKPSNMTIHGEMMTLRLDGRNIAAVHFPEFADALASSNKYDVVFHGHTHIQRVKRIGSTLLVNPGEIMNLNGNPSFAIYSTETNDVKIIEI